MLVWYVGVSVVMRKLKFVFQPHFLVFLPTTQRTTLKFITAKSARISISL